MEKQVNKDSIKLSEFLTWLKNEIKKSEDEATEIEPSFKEYVPNALESREMFFRTAELEVELNVEVTKTQGGRIQTWVLQWGAEKKTENVQRVRIKLVSQGHIFPRGYRLRAK